MLYEEDCRCYMSLSMWRPLTADGGELGRPGYGKVRHGGYALICISGKVEDAVLETLFLTENV